MLSWLTSEELQRHYRTDNEHKEFEVHFPNGELEDLTNEDIVSESLRYTESACSGSSIKFGLVEADRIEFETVGVPNIKGMVIECEFNIRFDVTRNAWTPMGRYVVDECKREKDLERRRVVAYSSTVDNLDTISPWERIKIDSRINANVPYTYNPVHLALSSISQIVDLDYEALGVFTGAQTPEELGDIYYRAGVINNPDNCEWIATYECKTMDLMDMKEASNVLYAYRCGKSITDIKTVINWFTGALDECQFDLSNAEQSEYCEMLKEALSPSCVHGTYRDFSWLTSQEGRMRSSGIISPLWTGYAGTTFKLCLPYKLEIEIKDIAQAQVLISESFDIYNPYSIRVEKVPATAEGQALFIPSMLEEISRKQVYAGEFVVTDKSGLPNCKNILEAWLELNGSFMGIDRKTNLYQIYNLSAMGDLIYPDETTFPGEETFPSGEQVNLDDCKEIWYDDDYIEPYTEIVVNYTNESGEAAQASVYEPKYTETESEIATLTPDNVVSSNREFRYRHYLDLPQTAIIWGHMAGLKLQSVIMENVNREGLFDAQMSEGDTIFTAESDQWDEAKIIHVTIQPGQNQEEYPLTLYKVEREEVEYTHKVWDVSENYLVKNYQFTESDITALLNVALKNVKDVRYMPVEIDARGLPYLEAGDPLVVATKEGDVVTVILQRTLKGIQALEDTFIAN